MTKGSTMNLTKSTPDSIQKLKQDLSLTNTDLKQILKIVAPIKSVIMNFVEGLNTYSGIMVLSG